MVEQQESVVSNKGRESVMSSDNQPIVVNKKLDEGYSSDDD